MADDLILTSTTDSLSDVQAALGVTPEAPAAPVAPPEPAPTEPAAVPAPTPSESLAGRTLNQKKQKVQARIDRLKAEAKEAGELLDDERKARLRLEQEVTALKNAVSATPRPDAAQAAPDEPEPTEDKFDTFTDFTKAHTKWTVAQELKAERAREQQRRTDEATQRAATIAQAETVRLNAEFEERLNETRARHADAAEVFEKAKDTPLAAPLAHAVRTSDVGAELLYYLSTKPEEAVRINQLPPYLAEREIGKLEARMEAGSLFSEATDDAPPVQAEPVAATPVARPAAAAPAKPVSRAPAPLARIGGSGSAAMQKTPDQMTMAEYNAWRNATGVRRGRR